MVLLLVIHRCESKNKKAECWRIDALKLWCWRRVLRVPWTAMRPNQSILKKINPEYSLKGLMLKFQYFSQLYGKSQLIGKDPDAGKDWKQEKGTTEDEMVGWSHRLNGHEFEQTPGYGEGQGSLVCCSPWRCRVRHDWPNKLNVSKNVSMFQISQESHADFHITFPCTFSLKI